METAEHEFETAAAAPSPEVKTAERWAEELGHLPHFRPGTPPAGKPKKRVAKAWNPKFELYQGTKNFHAWPVGKELTKDQYLAAIDAARKAIFR